MAVKAARMASPEMEGASPNIPEGHAESLLRLHKIASRAGTMITSQLISTDAPLPTEPGIYIFDDEASEAANTGPIHSAEFNFSRQILSGRIDSAHAVLPGQLTAVFKNPDTTEEREKVIPIAAKEFFKRNFDERHDRIGKEIRLSQAQRQLGEVGFRPVAVIIDDNGTHNKDDHNLILVSELDEAVTTLDNSPWQLGLTEQNIATAKLAVSALGRFNVNFGMHGDAKIKNVAQKPDGSTSMIDFETHQPEHQTTDNLGAATIVFEDLYTFMDSLRKRGFFNKETNMAVVRPALEDIVSDYLDVWGESAETSICDAVFGQASDVIERCMQDILEDKSQFYKKAA